MSLMLKVQLEDAKNEWLVLLNLQEISRVLSPNSIVYLKFDLPTSLIHVIPLIHKRTLNYLLNNILIFYNDHTKT